METSSIMELINTNPVFHIATCEDGNPHVRAVFLFRANEKEIIFHTGTMKSLHDQLQKNPEVELCFNDMKKNIQVRIQGKANQKNDPELIQEIINHPTREFLRPWVEAEGTDILAVYCIEDLRAAVWSMETNLDATRFEALN